MGGDPVVWKPGTAPADPSDWHRPRSYRPDTHPVPRRQTLACFAPGPRIVVGRKARRSIRWREGAKGTQHSRFGAVRVRTAHKHTQGRAPGPEEWLLYEWQADEPEPTRFWLSDLPANTPPRELVRLAKLRWRVERTRSSRKRSGSTTSRAEAGAASITTSLYTRPRTRSSRSTKRYSPPRAQRWTLPTVRRLLQLVLLRRIGWCSEEGRRSPTWRAQRRRFE
jgi:hypothetical protein